MNWLLKNHNGHYVTQIDQFGSNTQPEEKSPVTGTQALVFHGTRDYVEGVIFALELVGHERFYPILAKETITV